MFFKSRRQPSVFTLFAVRAYEAANDPVERKREDSVIERRRTKILRPAEDVGLGREDEEKDFCECGSQRNKAEGCKRVVAEKALFQPADTDTDKGSADNKAAESACGGRRERGMEETREETERGAFVRIAEERTKDCDRDQKIGTRSLYLKGIGIDRLCERRQYQRNCQAEPFARRCAHRST